MKQTCVFLCFALLACARSADRSPAPAAPSSAASPPSAPVASGNVSVAPAFDAADVIVVGTLRAPRIDGVLEKDPPVYVHAFEIAVEGRLAGAAVPSSIASKFSSESQSHVLPAQTRMIVALRRVEGTLPERTLRFETLHLEPASAELEAALGARALRAPDGLSLHVAQMPAASGSPSPSGDGVFELSIRNEGTSSVTVAGLFAVGGAARWEDALRIHDQTGRVLSLPHGALPAGAQPVVLAPNAEVKTQIDVKPFGVVRPAGGENRMYAFAVGPLRTSSWFYYVHTFHGPRMGAPKP